MSRPELVRADTLDLQDQEAPSAQDHTHQPTQPALLGDGPPAPHQQSALRHVEEERSAEQNHFAWASQEVTNEQNGGAYAQAVDSGNSISRDISFDNGSHLQSDYTGMDHAETLDMDGDDLVDDDMLDKMSSSPSIEDGGSPSSPLRPKRPSSLHVRSKYPRDAPAQEAEQAARSVWLPVPCCKITLPEHNLSSEKDTEVEHHKLSSTIPFSTNHHAPLLPKHYPSSGSESTESHENDAHGFLPAQEVEEKRAEQARETHDSMGSQQADPRSSSSSNWISARDDSSDSDYEAAGEDDVQDFFVNLDSRFLDSGWDGECLRDTEDIDFEFVYALHTFVATVEGQANAAKGDTMVLLDDTNSYWWLVKLVKDSSIGYLPAEHIETPTERLARLNKHRNIDLSAAMLGDNPERSKNPLKKAMRRRNAKMVSFSAPTFHEASGIDWSDSDDDLADTQRTQVDGAEQLQATGTADTAGASGLGNSVTSSKSLSPADQSGVLVNTEQTDLTSRLSRNGYLRDTDSFLKDDTAEPKKISLTPSLLKDDHSSSVDSRESSVNSPDTFEEITKKISPTEKDKKSNKKTGMLRGLFRRTDKKGKSENAGRSLSPRQDGGSQLSVVSSNESDRAASYDSVSSARDAQPQADTQQAKRQAPAGRLLKSPPPVRGHPPNGILRSPIDRSYSSTSSQNGGDSVLPSLTQAMLATPISSQSALAGDSAGTSQQHTSDQPQQDLPLAMELTDTHDINPLTPLFGGHYVELDNNELPNARAHHHHMQNDDPQDLMSRSAAIPVPSRAAPQPPASEIITDVRSSLDHTSTGLLDQPQGVTSVRTELPIRNGQIVPLEPDASANSLATDTSGTTLKITTTTSTNASSSSTTTLQDSPSLAVSPSQATTPASARVPASNANQWDDGWNDAVLLKYLDKRGHNDAKDLLLLVHDKHDVAPVTNTHPIMMALGYQEKQHQLNSLQGQLDRLLNDWVARKAHRKARLGQETGLRLARVEALKKRLG